MKKGQEVSGQVVRVDFPNKGVVQTQEGMVAVKNVIPGQKVSCRVTKCRKGKAEGIVLETLEPSVDEVAADCPHFGECGGCLYRTLPYEKQIKLKEDQVRSLLEPVLKGQEEAYEFESILGSPSPDGYRNKMEFSFGDEYKDGPLALGMHKRGSFYDIVTVDQCRIVDSDYQMILTATLTYFKELQAEGVPVSYFHRLRHIGFLRHLLVRRTVFGKEILVALVTCSDLSGIPEEGCMADRETVDTIVKGFADMICRLPLSAEVKSVQHIRNDSVADAVKADEVTLLYGQEYITEKLLGLEFKISVFSFFQTNSAGAEVLYQKAREYSLSGGLENGDNDRAGQSEGNKVKPVIFDLYSGTGTIAQILAPVAGSVVGVEIVEEAVEAAKQNAADNGLNNCTFLAGDVLKVLDDIEEKPDFIVLDPPRDGIHPKALQKIIAYGVDHIVYISCKPTSLARDLEVFLAQGYRVEKVCPVDQFPATANVETVCLLSKKNSENFVEIGVDAEE